MEKTLTLQLTVDDVNLILSTLSNRPFAEVHLLIQKIQTQAAPQFTPQEEPPGLEGNDIP